MAQLCQAFGTTVSNRRNNSSKQGNDNSINTKQQLSTDEQAKHPSCHLSPLKVYENKRNHWCILSELKKEADNKTLFFYCQPYYQVLLSWYKRLFCRCLNTKSWQMTIECPKNSLCRSNSDPLISLYEIGDQSEISVVFSLFLSVRFWMMNEELLCSVIAQPILHSSFPYSMELKQGFRTDGYIASVYGRMDVGQESLHLPELQVSSGRG